MFDELEAVVGACVICTTLSALREHAVTDICTHGAVPIDTYVHVPFVQAMHAHIHSYIICNAHGSEML